MEQTKYKEKYLKYKAKYLNTKGLGSNMLSMGEVNFKTNDNTKLIPRIGKSKRLLQFDFPEISIASVQYNEGPTGCTYIRFNVNTTSYYMDARGGAVMTYASDKTRTGNKSIRGICFAGGSFLGLEAISGCVIEEVKNVGYLNFGKQNITGAALRSANLNYNCIYPDKYLGRFAVKNLSQNEVYLGQVGVGCMAGDGYYGQGAHFVVHHGIRVFVLTGVNALGAIYDNKGVELKNRYKLPRPEKHPIDDQTPKNTTLTVVVTDLSLNLLELEQLAVQCHTNMAVVIRPFHTIGDGDVLFAVTLGLVDRNNVQNFDLEEFYQVCSSVTNQAVISCLDP